jgi:hypothetical protein
MAESKSNRVQFEELVPGGCGRRVLVTWIASRPSVLPMLKEVSSPQWGTFLNFFGSREELISAGLASPEMFENIGKVQKSGTDDFGNRYTLRRRKGIWELDLRIDGEGYRDPIPLADDSKAAQCWWEKYGQSTMAETAEILSRFARK